MVKQMLPATLHHPEVPPQADTSWAKIKLKLMKTAQELAIQHFLFWKSLIVGLVFLFSLVAFPWQGSSEGGLNQGNVLNLVNQIRTDTSLSPLRSSLRLEQAARAKAEDILEKGYFSHTSPEGAKPWDFIKNTGMAFSFAGENLAINYTSIYELVNDLLNSPSHRDNLLSPLFSETGIAIVKGNYQGQEAVVTVQMFARPAAELFSGARP